MTRITRFNVKKSVIYVTGTVAGTSGEAPIRLVFDTGASPTLIVPRVIEQIGYSPRNAVMVTSVHSPLGKEHGYAVRLARFATLGFSMSNFPVNVLDLSDRDSCDGLVGLNFLRRFNFQVRPKDGCIVLENIAPLAA